MRRNNKGFSLVELLVVIAIITVAVTLVGGSLATVAHARSKKAAQTLDAMIAQTKIDALSGMKCEMILGFSSREDQYICYIYREDPEDASNYILKEEDFGNKNLDIKVGNYRIQDGYIFGLQFDSSTGAVNFAKVTGNHSSDIENATDMFDLFTRNNTSIFGTNGTEAAITLESTGTHTITLYKGTGEHVLDA